MTWQSIDAFSANRRGSGRNGALVALSIAAALVVTFVAALAPIAHAAETPGNDPVKNNDINLPHVAADRTGSIPTKDTATLHLTADLGSIRLISLPPGASPEVRYSVHIETDARSPLADHLLDRYALTARNVPDGVEITGTLPPQLSRVSSNGAQFWVEFEVAIPRGFNVEVKTDAGDIETQDIGGAAQLVTQGGNIRAGRIGTERDRDASTTLVAKLETEGGHIQVADVAGDLNAFTTKEYTAFYVRVLSDALDLGLDILCDIITAPAFRPDEVDAERQVILEEILLREDEPAELVHEVLCQAMFPDHPLGREVLGQEGTVKAMEVGAIRDFFSSHYRPANMVFAAAGDLDHDHVVAGLRERLGEAAGGSSPLRRGPSVPPLPVAVTVTADAAHLHALSRRFPSISSKSSGSHRTPNDSAT